MEGEINNLILVWSIVVASLCYTHKVAQIFPTGNPRIIAIFPIIILFLLLPLNFTSIHFSGITSFFISWLSTFKLLLLTFNQGPLSSHPPIPLSLFLPLACFPIKIQQSPKKPHKSPLNPVVKVTILALLIRVYAYKSHIHPHIIMLCYALHMYLMLEMILSLFAAAVKALARVELEPHFNEPYLATSLQDFWGRRWNLMVSNILHPTVYRPVRAASARLGLGRWAAIPAVLATFLVSGLMHELIFYNIGRMRPSGEMIGFFLLHGVSLSLEIVVKKMCEGRLRLPRAVAGVLTLGYVIYTSFWLFFPPFLRAKSDLRSCRESLAFMEFVRNRRLVEPSVQTVTSGLIVSLAGIIGDISCPSLDISRL
ncbi:acyl-CoA--sterol O-acyltransferase 1-like isoform X2 [Salvia splendens]|uniref:acyl-CoA--sterol O-acyltransferase 1-like isoform X2 n=1 Tax=Salvia splendens TaxID=180675 RepID=UPI001C25E4FE|nr:acyl-CoA--sterol O-acyltransferase 1-like isoform X2 [Salvia splendens]